MEAKPRTVIYYQTPSGKTPFQDFVRKLKDVKARVVLDIRIRRAAFGNFGDHFPVGEGLFEMRIHSGPGYRIYYGLDGDVLVVVLTAGEKKSQPRDIKVAKDFWADYKKWKRSVEG